MMIEVLGSMIQRIPKGFNSKQQEEEYILSALDLGLRALGQASINADTSIVKDTFDEGAIELMNDLQNLVSDLFGKTDSLFHEAMDPTSPKSKVASLLELFDERCLVFAKNFTEAIEKMEENQRNELADIKEKFGIETAVARGAKVGTKKGIQFEQEVIGSLQSWQKFIPQHTRHGS